MKRVVEFKVFDTGYSFFENEEVIFEISNVDLQFNTKNFYQAFFANGKDYSEIELHEAENMDKKAKHVYSTVKQLLLEICDRLKTELIDAAGAEKSLDESKAEENE